MKAIIKKVSEEKALKGYVLTLSNDEKFFISKAQLEGNEIFVSSELRYTIEHMVDGPAFKPQFIDYIRLVRDPDFPFASFKEAATYAKLPLLLRHIVSCIKMQNPDNKNFPAGPITSLLDAAWKNSLSFTALPKQEASSHRIEDGSDLNHFISVLAGAIFQDKDLLDKDSFYLYSSRIADIFDSCEEINFDLCKYRIKIGEA